MTTSSGASSFTFSGFLASPVGSVTGPPAAGLPPAATGLPAPVAVVAAGWAPPPVAAVGDAPPPHAASTMPMTGIESPSAAPRLMTSRRE